MSWCSRPVRSQARMTSGSRADTSALLIPLMRPAWVRKPVTVMSRYSGGSSGR